MRFIQFLLTRNFECKHFRRNVQIGFVKDLELLWFGGMTWYRESIVYFSRVHLRPQEPYPCFIFPSGDCYLEMTNLQQQWHIRMRKICFGHCRLDFRQFYILFVSLSFAGEGAKQLREYWRPYLWVSLQRLLAIGI